MAVAKNYRSILLDDGKFAISLALAQKKKIYPYSFTIGDAYDFDPVNTGATLPSGTVVFTGGSSLIDSTILEKGKVRFSVTLPESVGGFTIGNIILYLQTEDGAILPFVWFVSDIPYPKQLTNGVGNRIIFNFIETIENIDAALNITVIPPEHFSLPQYSNESEPPQPELSLFQQFVIQQTMSSPTPVLAARRASDNLLFGTPLFDRVDSPFFGRIDGGRAGESRVPYAGRWFYGGTLTMNSANLSTYGGGNLLDDTPYLLGGEPLVDNFGYNDYDQFLNGEYFWGGRLEFPQLFYLTDIGGTPLNQTPLPEQTYGGLPLRKGD